VVSGALGGAEGGGRDGGSRRLPAITSSVEREGILRLYYSLISLLVQRAITFAAEYHNCSGWGIGVEAVEESCVLHRGIWGIGGGVGYRCIISVLRRSSQ